MPSLGGPESIVILLVVLLLFGVGRVSRIGGELGTAIREFRKGLAGDDEKKSLPEGTNETITADQRESQHVNK
jgi:sec-independent protein translocase protein TatA